MKTPKDVFSQLIAAHTVAETAFLVGEDVQEYPKESNGMQRLPLRANHESLFMVNKLIHHVLSWIKVRQPHHFLTTMVVVHLASRQISVGTWGTAASPVHCGTEGAKESSMNVDKQGLVCPEALGLLDLMRDYSLRLLIHVMVDK